MVRSYQYSLDYPVVQTAAGRLRGFVLDGIFTFYGIRYAEAERFCPPRPVTPWEGIRDASSYGCICPGEGDSPPVIEQMIAHRYWPEDEHCQYLNIWTPGLQGRRPVLVWLHGGGYSFGSSLELTYFEGDALSEYGDAVVVSLNHRLNIFGFLDMSPYGERYANSANAGMADIVEALRWIRENIAAFGGDPENVTLFGQSGGGGKVCTLLQTPAADGLFHKAVIMSGVLQFPGTPASDHRPLVEGILELLHLPDAEALTRIPWPLLQKAGQKVRRRLEREQGYHIFWGPCANDWYLGDPMKAGFRPHAWAIPTMVGTVISEFGAFEARGDHALSEADKLAKLRAAFGDRTEEVIRLMRQTYPDKDPVSAASLDLIGRIPTAAFAREKARVSAAPTYLYQFALTFPILGGVDAWHCSDIPFFFHNTHRAPYANIPGVTERLEEQIAGSLVRFARTGDPNGPELPRWDPCGPETQTMVFDTESRCRTDYDTALLTCLRTATSPRPPITPAADDDGEEVWIF